MTRESLQEAVRSTAVALALLFAASICAAQEGSTLSKPLGPGRHTFTVECGERIRTYSLHVPAGRDPSTPLPAVVMFHGGGGTGRSAVRSTGWIEKADAEGFLVLFPEGTPPDPTRPGSFRHNPQTWNDGSGRSGVGAASQGVEDVEFVSAMLDDLRGRIAVDQRRIYATGFSNGASMAFRVARELSTVFAAAAPVAGVDWMHGKKPSRPVPLIYITGTADPLNPVEGGEIRIGLRSYGTKPPTGQMIERWAKMHRCAGDGRVVLQKDGVTGVAFGRPGEDAAVVLYTIEDHGHHWPGGKALLPGALAGEDLSRLDATDVIWEFFEEHALVDGDDEAPDGSLEAALDRALAEVMASHPLPGLAVGVVKDGRIVYAKGFGKVTLGEEAPVTERSLFHMASVSKTFVAAAILQLVEQGKVDLDAPISTYIPYFRLDDERCGEITVQQMLTHTSGMPDVRDYGWDSPECDDGALERYVRGLADRKLLFAPGSRFRYSNMAYEVLGDVIATVSGMPFKEYVKRNILDVLGMRDSTFLLEETAPDLRTRPHVGFPHPVPSDIYPYNRAHAPSSTLQSSAADMCRWLIAHLEGGALGGKRILGTASCDMLWKKRADVGRGRSIGLSWFLDRYDDRWCILHGGADIGYQSYVILFPGESMGAVFLSNCTRFRMRILKSAVLDTVLEHGE